MGSDDKRGAARIQAKTSQAEYDAFATWIKACAGDAKLRATPKLDEKERAARRGPSR